MKKNNLYISKAVFIDINLFISNRQKVMKKKKFIIIFITIITLLITITVFITMSTKSDTAFLKKQNEAYENVYVIDGSNGNSVRLTDEDKELLLEKLKSLKITKDYFCKPSTEWLYNIQFTIEGKLYIVTIINNHCMSIGENKFYQTEATDLINCIKNVVNT